MMDGFLFEIGCPPPVIDKLPYNPFNHPDIISATARFYDLLCEVCTEQRIISDNWLEAWGNCFDKLILADAATGCTTASTAAKIHDVTNRALHNSNLFFITGGMSHDA